MSRLVAVKQDIQINICYLIKLGRKGSNILITIGKSKYTTVMIISSMVKKLRNGMIGNGNKISEGTIDKLTIVILINNSILISHDFSTLWNSNSHE